MASLIHTNREATDPTDDGDDATFRSTKKNDRNSSSPEASSPRRRSRRQLTLDTSFRPVKKQLKEEEPSSDGEEDELFDAEESEEGKGKGKGRRRTYDGPSATLVVAPVSLLHQWESELKKSAKKNSLRVISESIPLGFVLKSYSRRVHQIDGLLIETWFRFSRRSLPWSFSRGRTGL